MRNSLICCAIGFLLFLTSGLESHAADVNYWVHPGGKPLSTSVDGRDAFAVNCATTKLPVPADVAQKFHYGIEHGLVGKTVEIKDGDRFVAQAFQGCTVWKNVVAKFDPTKSYERRMEVITIKANDGTIVTYGRPYICNNWSIIDITPPPPKPNCYIVSFDHGQTDGVVRETTEQFQAQGTQEWPSAAQAFLNPEMEYTYVLAHIDVSSDEDRAELMRDACFGTKDSTGFHQGVMYCERFCVGGKYPPARFIEAYARATGVQLPEKEPQGSFQFPCAEGKCELHLPLRYATRFAMYCVAVQRYRVSLAGFRSASSNFRFDLVYPDEGARSLAMGKKKPGDIYLLNDSGRTRFLTGADAY